MTWLRNSPLSFRRLGLVSRRVLKSSQRVHDIVTITLLALSPAISLSGFYTFISEEGFASSPSRSAEIPQSSGGYYLSQVDAPSLSPGGRRGIRFYTKRNLIAWASTSTWVCASFDNLGFSSFFNIKGQRKWDLLPYKPVSDSLTGNLFLISGTQGLDTTAPSDDFNHYVFFSVKFTNGIRDVNSFNRLTILLTKYFALRIT